MAGFRRMVSMTRSPEEKAEQRLEDMMPPSILTMPDVPPGLCIVLTEKELAKLDLDDEAEVGDTIHLMALAKVTSIRKEDTSSGCTCRIELSITDLSVEDENDEGEEEEE